MFADKAETQIVWRRADRAATTFPIPDEVRHVCAVEALHDMHPQLSIELTMLVPSAATVAWM
jgi:hypothetical protein